MPQIVQCNVVGSHIAVDIMCLRLVDAEPEHIALGNPAHRRHTLIVCIEHRDRIRRLPTYDLALCLGDAFHRTEFTQMGDAHLEHYSDVRRCDLREPGDLTDVVGPHLSHQVSRAFPTFSAVKGSPISLLNDPFGATVSPCVLSNAWSRSAKW